MDSWFKSRHIHLCWHGLTQWESVITAAYRGEAWIMNRCCIRRDVSRPRRSCTSDSISRQCWRDCPWMTEGASWNWLIATTSPSSPISLTRCVRKASSWTNTVKPVVGPQSIILWASGPWCSQMFQSVYCMDCFSPHGGSRNEMLNNTLQTCWPVDTSSRNKTKTPDTQI